MQVTMSSFSFCVFLTGALCELWVSRDSSCEDFEGTPQRGSAGLKFASMCRVRQATSNLRVS